MLAVRGKPCSALLGTASGPSLQPTVRVRPSWPCALAPRPASVAPQQHRAAIPHNVPSSSTPTTDAIVSSDPPTVETVGDAAALLGSAWDPEGLFSRAPGSLTSASGGQMGDLIARRERERAARRAAAAAAAPAASDATMPGTPNASTLGESSPTATATPQAPAAPPRLPAGLRPLVPLPSGVAAAGAAPDEGVPVSALPPGVVSELEAQLGSHFMPVDLSWPGLRVLHLDPPVLTVEGFMGGEQCGRMVAAAEASGRMVASRVGASNVAASYGNTSSNRRTSSGMMVTPGSAGPAMDAVVAELQARGKQLLRAGEGPAWGPPGKLPRSSQYCYESIQVARYERGQHFLAHEDGFPPPTAAANGFQRHATLLVYLNDCAEGGATRFDFLDLAVRPRRGRALLFFPAFADGRSDLRSLHTAEDAVDTKYVTQQWIARGLPQPAAAPPAATLAGGATAATRGSPSGSVAAVNHGSAAVLGGADARREAELEERERAGRQGKGARAGAKAGKGFGGGSKPGK